MIQARKIYVARASGNGNSMKSVIHVAIALALANAAYANNYVGIHGAGTPSFECSNAATKQEKLVCSSPLLGDLDAWLMHDYRQALLASKDKDSLKASERAWMTSRSKCEDVKCLEELYRLRINELGISPSPAAVPVNGVIQAVPAAKPAMNMPTSKGLTMADLKVQLSIGQQISRGGGAIITNLTKFRINNLQIECDLRMNEPNNVFHIWIDTTAGRVSDSGDPRVIEPQGGLQAGVTIKLRAHADDGSYLDEGSAMVAYNEAFWKMINDISNYNCKITHYLTDEQKMRFDQNEYNDKLKHLEKALTQEVNHPGSITKQHSDALKKLEEADIYREHDPVCTGFYQRQHDAIYAMKNNGADQRNIDNLANQTIAKMKQAGCIAQNF